MSYPNLETVKRAYAEVNDHLEPSRDLSAQKGMREYWEMFEDFHVDIKETLHADDELVVNAVRDGGRMKDTDSEVWNDLFHVFKFQDGKIVRFSSHTDRGRALAAAGLEAPTTLQGP